MPRVGALLGWLPLVGVLLCLGVVVLFWQELLTQGEIEGSASWDGGRYVEVVLNTGEVKGHLLPPPVKSAKDEVESAAPSTILDTSGTVQVDKNSVKLRAAPNMALVEKSDFGLLPAVRDDVYPWKYYGRPFTKLGNVSLISVVVTGLGMHKELGIAASRLPPDICLSVSPYAKDVPVWMQSMRAQGHEFLLDLPMEPDTFPAFDPGPSALMTSIMPEENMTRLKRIMGKSTGYIGLVIPHDEVYFSGQKDFIQPVVQEMAKRGVMGLFTKFQDRPALNDVLGETELVHLSADIFIRYGADINEITQQLSAAESVADKRGSAIVVVQASPVALDVIKKWTEALGEKGFQLTPLSVLAR